MRLVLTLDTDDALLTCSKCQTVLAFSGNFFPPNQKVEEPRIVTCHCGNKLAEAMPADMAIRTAIKVGSEVHVTEKLKAIDDILNSPAIVEFLDRYRHTEFVGSYIMMSQAETDEELIRYWLNDIKKTILNNMKDATV